MREVFIDGNAYLEIGDNVIDARVAMEHLKISIDNVVGLNSALSKLYLAGQLTESDFLLWEEAKERAKQLSDELSLFRNLYYIVNKGYGLN